MRIHFMRPKSDVLYDMESPSMLKSSKQKPWSVSLFDC